jgi:hypothetical protein
VTRVPEITPSPAASDAGTVFARFVELIARLRAPGGCPWDREQTHESVKPMTIEEAYEVAHATTSSSPRSSVICCCKWCSTPTSPRSAGRSGSAT